VVTFFPDPDFPQRLKRISDQVDRVIVVDKGMQGKSLETLNRAVHRVNRLELLPNSDNFGIATALNQGARKALEHQYPWVITFDQENDSQYWEG
jgi:rhamnosyltransferase